MNSAKAVFNIDPTGCDFHYNQTILRKIGKKGLKKTMNKNAEFEIWVYQIMAINHLPPALALIWLGSTETSSET